MKHEKETLPFPLNPSAEPVLDQPETAPELLRKYGTYNIQPTSETSNPYPAIAAGLGRPHHKTTDAIAQVEAQKRAEGSADS